MHESKKKICAIVLAAGESRRFGAENKLLVELDGVTVLERVVRCIAHSGVNRTIVVTGAEHYKVVSLLSEYTVECFHNADWQHGMGCSLAYGVSLINRREYDGVMVCLGDLPFLEINTTRHVLNRFMENEANKIVVPVCNGRQGHPLIFPVAYREELSLLKGDEGARGILRANETVIEQVHTGNDGIFRDIDRPSDL